MPKIGDYCKFGTIDYIDEMAPGVQIISTPSHGGLKLNRKTNARIPKAFREPGGWYEEDCEIGIPFLFLPELEHEEEGHKIVKNWYPIQYENHFRIKIQPGESHIKDEMLFYAANLGKFLTEAAWGDWHEEVPKGFVGVKARNYETNEEAYFLVPQDEYDSRGIAFIIDTNRHQKWERKAA